MNTYERVKELAKIKKISIAQLERQLNLSNGSVSKWAHAKPNSEPLEKVAEFFNVSTDYLLGRSETIAINNSERRNESYFRITKDDLDNENLDEDEIRNYIEDVESYAEMRKRLLLEKKKL